MSEAGQNDPLASLLRDGGLGDLVDKFRKEDITLDMIPDLTTEEFAHLGISIGQKQKVLALVSKKTATTTAAAATAEISEAKAKLEGTSKTEKTVNAASTVISAVNDYGGVVTSGLASAFSLTGALSFLESVSTVGSQVPMVGALFAAANEFVSLVQTATAVKKNALKLAERIFAILETVRVLHDEGINLKQDHLTKQIQRLEDLIKRASQTLKKYSGKGFLKKLLTGSSDSANFTDLDADFVKTAQDLQLAVETAHLVQASKNSAALQTRMDTLFEKIAETKTYPDSGAVLVEKANQLGGAEAILKDTAKLKQLADSMDMGIDDLRAEMNDAMKDLQLSLQTRDYFSAVFRGVEAGAGETVGVLTIETVFAPPPEGALSDLIPLLLKKNQSVFSKEIMLRSIPTLPAGFSGRDDVVNNLVRSLSPGITWLAGPKGAGKSVVAVAVAHRLVESVPVHFINTAGVSAGSVPFTVLSFVSPSTVNTDASALIAWAVELKTRTVLVLDSFVPSNDMPWLKRLSELANLAVLVTSTAEAPSYASSEVQLAPLVKLTLPRKPLATILFKTAPAAPLFVFKHPFSEDAALAVLGTHTIGTEAPKEETRALFRSLLAMGAIVRSGEEFEVVNADNQEPSETGIERFCHFFIKELQRASDLYMSPNLADGLAIVDKNRAHLDRLLLEIALPAVVLSELVDALLTGTILNARWIETVINSIFQHLATSVETEQGRELEEHDLILAYGLRFSDRPKSQQLLNRFADDKTSQLVAAAVWHADGFKLLGEAKYSDALVSYNKALAIRENVLGKEHPDMADSYLGIANVCYSQGDYPRALECYNKALAIYEKVLGKEHPDTARSYNNIAIVYYAQGDYPRALECYNKALAIYEKVLGKEHPGTATSYNNIAIVYDDQGDYPRALECYNKALAIYEKVLGKEHPGTATSYNNIATVYSDQGDYPRALEYCNKDLAICEKVLGKEHPDTAMSYNNISNVYLSQGDYPRALEYHNKALAIQEKVLGKDHPDTANSYNNIGLVYKAQGDYPRALECYNKARAIREKVLGKEHPDTAMSYNNMAIVYKAQGDYPRVLEYHNKALAIREKVLGKNHKTTADTCYNLALAYNHLGNKAEALRFMAQAHDSYLKSNGADFQRTKNAAAKLAEWTKNKNFFSSFFKK